MMSTRKGLLQHMHLIPKTWMPEGVKPEQVKQRGGERQHADGR